jgi:hypothetical protein
MELGNKKYESGLTNTFKIYNKCTSTSAPMYTITFSITSYPISSIAC